MISGLEISRLVSNGQITMEPFDKKNLSPNSYDCRLGNKMARVCANDKLFGIIPFHNTHKQSKLRPIEMKKDRSFVLWPWFVYLGHTIEYMGGKYYVGKIHGRSSVARHGATTHLCAGFLDCGWFGQVVLEIKNYNFWPMKLFPGDRVCQVEFEKVEGEVDLYHSTYQGQRGIVGAKGLGDE